MSHLFIHIFKKSKNHKNPAASWLPEPRAYFDLHKHLPNASFFNLLILENIFQINFVKFRTKTFTNSAEIDF